jgi:hypothetical protein
MIISAGLCVVRSGAGVLEPRLLWRKMGLLACECGGDAGGQVSQPGGGEAVPDETVETLVFEDLFSLPFLP